MLRDSAQNWPNRILVSHWQEQTSVRDNRFRLDHADHLFDLWQDPGQQSDVSNQYPTVQKKLLSAKHSWQDSVLIELPKEDQRPLLVGHPDLIHTELPARDAVAHGNLVRSNRWPNCSFFTDWVSTDDSLTWRVEVQQAGDYAVDVYYTCTAADTGVDLSFCWQGQCVSQRILVPHDPPLSGMSQDRIPRQESYVKPFRPLRMGTLSLSPGEGDMTLQATSLPGDAGPDIRRVMLRHLR